MSPRRTLAVSALLLVAGAAVVSCLDATQITLEVRTDLPCALTRGLSITAGSPGTTERAAPSTETSQCLPTGEIGTLVVTPENGKSSEVSFRVVMGVDRPLSACTIDDGYKGCIVQRRQLAYVPRKPLTVPVYMLLVCVGVPCDEDSTCAANGKCVPARIDDPSRCVGAGCFPPGDPAADAAPPTPPVDGAPADVDTPDGTTPQDGGTDGGREGGPRDGGFFCPHFADGSDQCELGTQQCCLEYPMNASCTPTGTCQTPPNGALHCTGTGDCVAGSQCCGALFNNTWVSESFCKPSCESYERVVCHPADVTCPAGRSCTPSVVGGYGSLGLCLFPDGG
jgi:hypothetical protein